MFDRGSQVVPVRADQVYAAEVDGYDAPLQRGQVAIHLGLVEEVAAVSDDSPFSHEGVGVCGQADVEQGAARAFYVERAAIDFEAAGPVGA